MPRRLSVSFNQPPPQAPSVRRSPAILFTGHMIDPPGMTPRVSRIHPETRPQRSGRPYSRKSGAPMAQWLVIAVSEARRRFGYSTTFMRAEITDSRSLQTGSERIGLVLAMWFWEDRLIYRCENHRRRACRTGGFTLWLSVEGLLPSAGNVPISSWLIQEAGAECEQPRCCLF